MTDGKFASRIYQLGGLYRIESVIRETACTDYRWAIRGAIIYHVGVGDVFVIAGQSNSSGYGKDQVSDGPELGVHLFKNSDRWDLATHPLNDSTDTKHEVNMEMANSGTSPHLSFAKYLKKRLGYPIGLIQTALGGSSMSSWNPEKDGGLYKNMVERIKMQGRKVKGILWYQGCSDTVEGLSYIYEEQFMTMVKCLREELEMPQLPFYTVQLNRCLDTPFGEEDREWTNIREIQRQMTKKVDDVYMVPAIDGPLCDAIHNTSYFNIVLGERIAKMVLGKTYGQKVMCEAPDIVSVKMQSKLQIDMEFAPVYGTLYIPTVCTKELPFSVEDANGKKEIENYEIIENNKIRLTMKEPLGQDGKVHCSYGKNPKGVLVLDTETQYPVIPFSDILVEK